MTATLRLIVRTPARVEVDAAVRSVTAEDGSGRFGVRPRGEPLLAALVPGLLTFRDPEGHETLVAIGSGLLDARPMLVDVAVREAVVCESLEAVRAEVLRASVESRQGENAMRDTFRRLHERLLVAMAREGRNVMWPGLRRKVFREADRMERARARGRRGFWAGLATVGAIGWMIALPTVGGAALGRLLDQRLGTRLTFTLALLLLGLATGSYTVWRLFVRETR